MWCGDVWCCLDSCGGYCALSLCADPNLAVVFQHLDNDSGVGVELLDCDHPDVQIVYRCNDTSTYRRH